MARRLLSPRAFRELAIQRRLMGGESAAALAVELALPLRDIETIARRLEFNFAAADAEIAAKLRRRQTLQLESIYFAVLVAWRESDQSGDPKRLAVAMTALGQAREMWDSAAAQSPNDSASEHAVYVFEDANWFGTAPESNAASGGSPNQNGASGRNGKAHG